jgi:hypothetical protein
VITALVRTPGTSTRSRFSSTNRCKVTEDT